MFFRMVFGIGIIVGCFLGYAETFKKTTYDAIMAYRYLYQCNSQSHTKTLRNIYKSLVEYQYIHDHQLTCSIKKVRKNTYLINYTIGNRDHQVEITVHRGPSGYSQKPSVFSLK